MVAHAPCEHAAHEEKTNFCTLFSAAMKKLKTDRASRRIVFIDANARMCADEPFVGACDPEPCNDNGERLTAVMKVGGMVAVNTLYPCGYTWRSAKGHTSRVDYVLYDAFRVDEVKPVALPIPWIWHVELRRTTAVLSVQLWSKVGLTLRTTKERRRKSTSTRHRFKIRSCVLSFKEDCGRLPRNRETAFLTMPRNSLVFY